MGWDSRPSYPPDALTAVTLKATDPQLATWAAEAKRVGKPRGPFVAYACDVYCAFLRAWRETHSEWTDAMEPKRRD